MKRPAIFFDRDNTLIVSDGYLGDPNGVVLMDGVADTLAQARKLGFAVVTISNQSGVARGLFTEDAVHKVNARLDQLLHERHPGAVIDRHEFCPFHPEAVVERYRDESDLRKPKPGMILRAARQMALDLHRSWVIGDAPRDIEAGHAAGCRTILFQPPNIAQSPETQKQSSVKPNYVCKTLAEAMQIIEANLEPPAAEALPEPQEAPPSSNRAESRSPSHLETIANQILHELKRRHEQPHHDFSVSKLLAGVMQILSIAVLVYAYFEVAERQTILLLAIALQVLTISLLVMGRQK